MTRKRTAGVAIVLAAVIAVVWLAFRDSPGVTQAPLTKVCPLVADSRYIQTFGDNLTGDNLYMWLDSSELLLYTEQPQYHSPFVIYNIATKQYQPVQGLPALRGDRALSASPDGKWILYNTQVAITSPVGIAAIRRVDGKTVKWPTLRLWNFTGTWMPDSRHWIGVGLFATGQKFNGHDLDKQRLVLYDVDHPGFKSFTIPGSKQFGPIVFGVTPQGKILFDDTLDPNFPMAVGIPQHSLREVSLSRPQPTARTFQVQVPDIPASWERKLSLSPLGDRLLWSCYRRRPNSIAAWIRDWTQHSYDGGAASEDIWICKLDGSAPYHVGTYSDPSIGAAVAWNPDGKHVSLTEQGNLYSIPVP